MNPAFVTLLLIVAAALEVGGDAAVRVGLHAPSIGVRIAMFVLGAAILFGYGLFVNASPINFGRVLGIYVVIFFVVAQIVNRVVFGVNPNAAVIVGGALILCGGAVMTVWNP